MGNCHILADCVANGSLYSQGYQCVCRNGLDGDGVTRCGAADPCAECDAYAKCVVAPGYSGAPVKKCQCQHPYIGDGFSCHKNDGKQETYADSGNPYVNEGATSDKPALVSASAFYGADGTNVDLFANFGDGTCSLMGYSWLAVEEMVKKMNWLNNSVREKNIKALRTLFAEFQNLGRAVLVRQGPSCNLDKAGRIPCNLLYFPINEHRCQLTKRIEAVFKVVADNCNSAWVAKFGALVDTMVTDNAKYKKGLPCPETQFL